MILALSLIILASATAALIDHQVRKAPDGFEDGTGFHVLPSTSGSRTIYLGHAAMRRESLRYGLLGRTFSAGRVADGKEDPLTFSETLA